MSSTTANSVAAVSAATGVAPQNYSAQLTANRLSPELAVATSAPPASGFSGGLVATGDSSPRPRPAGPRTPGRQHWTHSPTGNSLPWPGSGCKRSARRSAARSRGGANGKDLGRPRMIVTALQWSTFARCPPSWRFARITHARCAGENRPVFYVLVLHLLAAILLSINEPYEAIDKASWAG